MLSFLRTEGDAYNPITARAGEYAAAWTFDNVAPFERRLIRALPAGLRARAALRTARGAGKSDLSRLAGHDADQGAAWASIDLRGSLFCEVRETSMLPLCGFYASAIARVLQLFDVPRDARVNECRASGRPKGCSAVGDARRGARRTRRSPHDRRSR